MGDDTCIGIPFFGRDILVRYLFRYLNATVPHTIQALVHKYSLTLGQTEKRRKKKIHLHYRYIDSSCSRFSFSTV